MKRLGRLAHDPAQLALIPSIERYRAIAPASAAETAIDWTRDIAPGTWGMCLNDKLGCCTAAGVAHLLSLWGSYVAPFRFMADPEVEGLYEATGGYIPGQPQTDQGARCIDVLEYWRTTGVLIAGARDTIAGYCALDPRNRDHLVFSLRMLGALYAGVTLREAQQNQPVWDLGGNTALWGLHCISVMAADPDGLTCITWGGPQRMTWRWWEASCDEVYGVASPRWIGKGGQSPSQFPLATMLADMSELKLAA